MASSAAPGEGQTAALFVGWRRIVVTSAAALVLMAAGVSIYRFSHSAPTSVVAEQVDARFGELGISPADTIDPVLDKALRASRAIVAGDFATATQISADVLGGSTLQNWRFYPFEDFVADVLAASPPDIGGALDHWVANDKMNATPLLLRARYHIDQGWAKRGNDFADKTSDDQIAGFVKELKVAYADVDSALGLEPSNPYGFYLRLAILQGEGFSPALESAFADAIARYPTYYPLYELVLQTLQPRWGGSIEAMAALADRYAGQAPEFSPLRLLYLSLYRYLLSTGSILCYPSSKDGDELSQCVISFMNAQLPAGVEQKAIDALGLYDHTDKYQFGLEVKAIFSDMLATPGGDMHSAAMLQLAATSMHSDTQLKPENRGHSNYIIDELVAMSWQAKGFYDNAATKYNDALADAENASFPGKGERSSALGEIYDSLSEIAYRQNRLVDEIAFEKAAVLLGWPRDEDHICRGFYQLKQYEQAIRACTEAINRTGNRRAWYWRGAAYNQSGQQDLALADLKQSVSAGDYYSPYAAVDISMIYFGRDDNQSALAALNSYPPLYDAARTERSQIAVAYNNRCYAYMQLGEFQKALDDCTQSLRYGTIPEAVRKQQELLARLSSPGKGS